MRRAEYWVTGLAWLLAALHGAAALGKLLDLPGFTGVLAEYRLFPWHWLLPMAVAVVVFEAATAVGLMLIQWRRRAALASAALAGGYGMILTLTLARGIPLENCGCFGVYLARPLTVLSPLEDLALLVLSLVVAWRAM